MGEHMDGCTSIFSAPPFRVSGRKSTDWKEGVGGYDLAYLPGVIRMQVKIG